jgi:hypothetical protein
MDSAPLWRQQTSKHNRIASAAQKESKFWKKKPPGDLRVFWFSSTVFRV